MIRGLGICALAVFLAVPAMGQSVADRLNDYPTLTRVDYVFGCMATNGQTRTAMEQCTCSIDTIASILPFQDYEDAETVLSLRRTGGERMSFFRTAAMANNIVAELRRAQAEAEIICF